MRAILVVALVILAGCGDKKAEAPDEDFDAFGDFDLDGDADRGAIRGVVVDEAVLPIRGATVTIQGEDRSVQTNKDGAFGFGNLTAGVYFLKVSKLGYFNATPKVMVEAGVNEPAVTKVVLTRDALTAPYVLPYVWTGFVQCSMSGFPACRMAASFGVNDETLTVHEADVGTTWAQSEMQWVSNQEVSDELWLWHGYGDGSETQFGFAASSFGNLQGESPLVLVTNAATATAAGEGDAFAKLGVDHDLVPFVLGGSIPETQVLCGAGPYCGGIGFTFEQEFTVYTHLFYRYAPPDGWLFSRDGVPRAG